MHRIALIAVVSVLILATTAAQAFALVMPSSWYTYYAPGGWTYNAGATSNYNCLAYALGYTNQWIWPSYWGLYATEGEVDRSSASTASHPARRPHHRSS